LLRGRLAFPLAVYEMGCSRNVTSNVIELHFAVETNVQRMEQIMQGIAGVATGTIPAGASIDFMPLKTGPFLDTVQKPGKALLER
jgi:hypothetical protein